MNRTIAQEQEKGDSVSTAGLPRLCLWVFLLLLVASAVVIRVSIMTTPVRTLLVATLLLGILTGVLYFIRLAAVYPRFIFPAVFFLVLLLTWAVLGSKEYDALALRRAYVKQLVDFRTTPYVRGGETNRGIDRSGLARVAMWQAMIRQGVREVNPRLLGPLFWKFWWRDMSARAMLEGHYGYTRVIGHARRLAGYDTSRLNEGDLAVTTDGVHVLIYLGRGRWIEASPDDHKVVINKAPANTRRGWFRVPVTLMRWRILDR